MSHKLVLFHSCARTSVRLAMILAAVSGIARADWPAPLQGCGSLDSYIDVWQIPLATGNLCFAGNPRWGPPPAPSI